MNKTKWMKKIKLKFLQIVLIMFVIFFAFPVVLTITNSFMSEDEILVHYGKILGSGSDIETESGYLSDKIEFTLIPTFWSVKQYITLLFLSPDYLSKMWISVFLVIPIIFLQLMVSLMSSYAFMRIKNKCSSLIFFSYIILMLLPFQVTLVPNYMIAKQLNIYDTYASIILPAMFSTFGVYFLTKYMKRIPKEIIEAASIDGAGEWVLFRKICVPLCKSSIISTGMLIFIEYWNMVEIPLIMLGDSEKYPLSVYLSEIYDNEISLAFAVAVIYMIPSILINLLGNDYLVEGISAYGKR